jgi:hypothetical protein
MIGAWIDLATSVQYNPVLASAGVVVNPIWLLATIWTTPPIEYCFNFYICKVS